jgi:hypothetical protein
MVTIKNKHLRILTCLVILVLGISFVPTASASDDIPSIPKVFQGKLITGGADVPAGTVISAYIDSELVGSKTVEVAGKYQLDIAGTEEDNGKKIVFKLGLVESNVSATYQHDAVPVILDLSFNGDFVPPVIESCSVSPVYILNDGEDYSVVSAKVSDELSGVVSVTLDLTPIGGGVVSMTPESGSIYTCKVDGTQAGEFKFTLKATDYFGNSISDSDNISITLIKESELATKFGGADRSFSAEEIKDIVSNSKISTAIKYSILNIYYADGWDRI